MRTKDEIQLESVVIMSKVPGTGKAMVEHEHLFLEVWIDIRDILAADKKTAQEISKLMSKRKRGLGNNL